jgi:hypothetical protein
MALPAAEIVHQVPGRTRLRIAEKRGDRAYFSGTKRALEACPSVRHVSGSSLTGSLLLIHEGALDAVAHFARAQGIFDVGAPPLPETFATIAEGARSMEKRIRSRTNEQWGTAGVTFYALLGAGLWQAIQGRVLPPTVTLLFQALNVYKQAVEAEQAERSRLARNGAPPKAGTDPFVPR